MSDQLEESYQPEVEEGQSSQPEGEAQPKFVTVEDLTALEERLKRRLQSLTDKQESRISKRLREWEERAKAQGFEVDDQMRQEARRREVLRLLDEEGEIEPAQADLPRIDPAVKAKIEATNARYAELQREYGVTLTDSDPEYWDVNWRHRDPERFLKQAEAALKEKAERVGKQPGAQSQSLSSPSTTAPSPRGTAGASIDEMTQELGRLQTKANPTPAEEKRRKELVAELMKHIPRQ